VKQAKKIILAIEGLPGVGKTTASDYLSKKNLPIVHFGKIVNDYIDQHRLEHTKETHKKVWLTLREKYGQEAFAILNEENIRKALEKDLIIIDGMRSWEEYTHIKNHFPEVRIFIIAIFTDKEIRYKRSAKRKYRGKLYGEDRDLTELLWTNMGPTIAFADYLIINNSNLNKFHKSIDKVYKKAVGED